MVEAVTNYSTSILSSLIFQKGSLELLRRVGLLSVYLDDYGARKKYRRCVFFHFKINENQFKNKKDGVTVVEFISNMVDFKSFYDYYETPEGFMFVFKYNPMFSRDISLFKQGKFSKFSENFLRLVTDEFSEDVTIDISKEIYRYEK